MLCTATPNISSSGESINSRARVSRLSFCFLWLWYNACLTIAGAIKGTSTEKIYQEPSLESLKSRLWFRKLCHFYKIINEKSPSYLFSLIPNFNRVHNTRLSYNIPLIKVRHDYFKNSFFPSAITEWNKLDLNMRNSASLKTFKKKLLNFIRPCVDSIFDIHNPLGLNS